MNIKFTIPCKPLQWSRPEQQGRYHRYNKDEHNQYLKLVGSCCQAAMKRANNRSAPFSGPVNVAALFVMPYLKSASKKSRLVQGAHWKIKKPDLDNLLKMVLDGMNGIAYIDDAQACSFNGTEKIFGDSPATHIIISPLSLAEMEITPSGIGDDGVVLR